jgi:nitrite reductase/ring-hydroxylating ferredoxin subunit
MFKRKQGIDKIGYYSCGVSEQILQAGAMTKVKVSGRLVILTRVNGEVVAFDDTCPHGAASLAKGSLVGHKISCPDHAYCFDIRSGRIVWPEDENYRLRQYAVKLEDGEVKIRLGDI